MIKATVAGQLLSFKLGAVVVVENRKLCCRAKALDIVGHDSGTMFSLSTLKRPILLGYSAGTRWKDNEMVCSL